MPLSEVFNEDCNIGMARYRDKHFDLAIVDPPYFSGPEKRKYYGQRISNKGVKRIDYPITDKWDVPGPEYFDELIRVSKEQIVWGVNHYDYIFPGTGLIIWDKVNNDSSFSDCEVAYCSVHDSVRMFRYMWSGMMQGKSATEGHIMQGNKSKNERKIHPTQKPIILYQWLMKKYASPSIKVLSTHVGSGSDRIAAYDANIDFTGFEIDSTHFRNMEKRFKEYISQGKLAL